MTNSFRTCPFCGKVVPLDASICKHCGAALNTAENSNSENNIQQFHSGMENSSVPPEVANHYNWGAFFFNWIWAIVYKKYVLALILLAISFIPLLGALVFLGIIIWMGTQGNAWAWQAKPYKSVEEFHAIHRKWAFWGLGLMIIPIICGIVAALTIPSLMNATDKAQYKPGAKYVVSSLNFAANMNEANESKIKEYTSTGLADYFSEGGLKGDKSGDTIIMSQGMKLTFFGNGDCTDNFCRVVVDIDGDTKGPNQEWIDKENPSDIIMVRLKAKDNGQVQVYLPKVLAK